MYKKVLFSIYIIILSAVCASAQQQPLNWVNAHAISTDDNKNYLPAVAALLKGSTICGLGEASHGTHEFSVQKSQLINYLISNENYTSIGFESAYSVMARVNKYVLLGAGDLKEIMKPLGLFNTQEIYDLFQSIRAFNAARPATNKVTIYGFDIDYIKADIDSSASYCLSYLAKHKDKYTGSKNAVAVLNRIKAPGFGNLYEMADDEISTIANLINEVKNKGTAGDNEADQTIKHLSLLHQGTLVTNPLARDEFMAENIAHTQQLSKAKTIIWSHNVHVAKDTTMAMCKGMGYYIRQRYQKQYYAIGFDTFKGSTNAIVDGEFESNNFEMQPSSLSALFAKAKYPNFFIEVNATQNNPLYNVSANITNIFSNWGKMRTLQIRPGVDFDSIVFIRETTASVPLK